MIISAGQGMSLPELQVALFGSTKEAKAFRAFMKEPKEELLPLAAPGVYALTHSHAFRQAWQEFGWPVKWSMQEEPMEFAKRIGDMLKEVKRVIDLNVGDGPKRLSAYTNKFLKEWVNTDGRRPPRPSKDEILELRPFRPLTTRVYYRGIRFQNLGQMWKFNELYEKGKAFPFDSNYWSSWSRSPEVAERFGRHAPADSQYGAMMNWLNELEEQKDYSGYGGYIVAARIAPEQCLVDLNHPDLPFTGGKHGNEGEIILLPNQKLVAKVYDVFGDVDREVKENIPRLKNPSDQYFFSYIGDYKQVGSTGGPESGTITFARVEDPWHKESPEEIRDSKEAVDVEEGFTRNLYNFKWLDGHTVAYKRMTDITQRVASRWITST